MNKNIATTRLNIMSTGSILHTFYWSMIPFTFDKGFVHSFLSGAVCSFTMNRM